MTDIKDLFLHQIRFDLMFKYLYLKKQQAYGGFTDFFKDLYIEHERVFNNFYEENPEKCTCSDFIEDFDNLYSSIKNRGFDREHPILVDKHNQVVNGAHRLTCCFLENIDVETSEYNKYFDNKRYNYDYFRKRFIDSTYADYTALEYVRLNPHAHIVNLQPVTSPEFDNIVENILEKYGFIYYKKNIFLSFNGLINLKKLFYGKDEWIGNIENDFKGAKKHAKASLGPYPLRAYIFVCDDLDNVRKAKEEIRDIYKIGNNSVHINDTHEEAIEIAECYFNDNSLFLLNNRRYNYESKRLDKLISILKSNCGSSNNICCAGSSPLNVFGIRESSDLDFLAIESININDDLISEHKDIWETYYPKNKYEIILNPKNYFYYKGLKFITLDILREMKENRGEKKDLQDINLIKSFVSKSVDYSKVQNMNFEIYPDILQKIIASVRAEILFKQSGLMSVFNRFLPSKNKMKYYRYLLLYKISSGKKKEHYLNKLKYLE